jgi:hypothetical protein
MEKDEYFASTEDIKTIFPELAESDDERIRKEIKQLIQCMHDADPRKGRWLAWLEKQGEQKPVPKFKIGDTMRTLQEAKDGFTDGMPVVVSIDEEYYHCTNELIAIKNQDKYEYPPINRRQKPVDKVEPKFENGQWIVWQNKCYKVNYNGCGYELVDQNGLSTSLEYGTIDESAHLWDITKDAKDGDVLQLGKVTAIFKEFIADGNCRCYCSIYNGEFEIPRKEGDDNSYGCYDATPATKEQRDLLFAKMKEAGYEWDKNKKELMEIHNALEDCEIENIEHGKYYYCIKDYYAGGNKRASKGDVIQALRGMNMMTLGVKANEYFIPVNTIKQEKSWSEEDSARLQRIIDFLWKNRKGDTDTIFQQEQDVAWLKSLKQRLA